MPPVDKKMCESMLKQNIRHVQAHSADVGPMLSELLTKITDAKTKDDLTKYVTEFQNLCTDVFANNSMLDKKVFEMMKKDLSNYKELLSKELS